jgi:hypothetical protein
MAGIAAGPAAGVLGEHVALDGTEVPQQVAKAEGALPVAPLDSLGRDRRGDTERAAADALEVGEEGLDGRDLHVGLLSSKAKPSPTAAASWAL